MEGKRIYEESYKELRNIRNGMSGESVAINFSKLDSATSGKIREALTLAVNDRIREVAHVITGVE